MKRILIAVLAVLALAVGADRGARPAAVMTAATTTARRSACSRSSPIPRGNPEGIAFDKSPGLLRRHRRRRRHLSRHAQERHRRAVHRRRGGQVGRRLEGQARHALRRGRHDRDRSRSTTSPPRSTVAKFETGAGGFLNDLVVTKKGDVYVTDSFRPTLWHVTADQVKAGGGTPQALPLGAPIVVEPGGEFNLNGIVAKSPRKLIVVDSNSGKLFRIKLNGDGDEIDEIDGSGRHGARRRRHAARPRQASWSSRGTRRSCRS